MMSTKNIALAALFGTFSLSEANIKSSGLWDGVDFYDTTAKIGVKNGIPYSNDSTRKGRIAAATAKEGDVSSYST